MNQPIGTHHKTITAILVEAGVVADPQVEAGLVRQRETGLRIGETLVELGFVSEEDIGWALARQLEIPFVDVDAGALDAELVRSFPEAALRRLQAVPFVRSEGRMTAAVADPTDREALQELARLTGSELDCVAATPSAIERALDALFGHRAPKRPAAPETPEGVRFDVVWERSGESFLNFHLVRARRRGATEIHFVTSGGFVHVLHRVASRLAPVSREPASVMDVLVTRLEHLGMPAAPVREDHVEGSVTNPLAGTELTLHVSMLSGREGLSVTVRLLRGPTEQPRIETLGMEPADVAQLRGVAVEDSGLIFVAGPPASGCGTTLSALLAELSTDERRWAVFARDRQRWIDAPGLVDVIAGPASRRWREIAAAHSLDGVVLDGGLAGSRVRAVTGSATHGRWVLARTDWEDTFSMIEWLVRAPGGADAIARKLRAVIQQRLIMAAAPEAASGGASADRTDSAPIQHAVFEVLVPTPAFRSALRAGARAPELRALAARENFAFLSDRIRAGVAAGRLEPSHSARALA